MMDPQQPVDRPTPFRVDESQNGDSVRILEVNGELDLGTAPQLQGALDEALAAPGATVLINLSGCEFMDSTGIALIVRAWQRSQDDGSGGFALCCANHQVQRVLDISGVGATIPLHTDLDSALAALPAG